MKDYAFPIILFLLIIYIALFGGVKKANKNGGGFFPAPVFDIDQNTFVYDKSTNSSTNSTTINQNGYIGTDTKLYDPKSTTSQYKNGVTLRFGNISDDPTQEYITLHANPGNKKNIVVSGWTLRSNSTSQQASIPKSTLLYYSNGQNGKDPVAMLPDENVYVITGHSPIGTGFKTNKCSGYLTQSTSFTPYLNASCPSPSKEDISGIPKTRNNDICFDLIDSYPSCYTQPEALNPNKYSYECQNFISKLNYNQCITTHRNDPDFWVLERHIYLERSESLWKNRRESISLIDETGKVVDTITR